MKQIILYLLLVVALSSQGLYAGQANPAQKGQNQGIARLPLADKAKSLPGIKLQKKGRKFIQKVKKSLLFSRLSLACSGLSLLSSLTMTELLPLLIFSGGFLLLALVFIGLALFYLAKEKKEGLFRP